MKNNAEEFWDNVEQRVQDTKDEGAKKIINPLIEAYLSSGIQGLDDVLTKSKNMDGGKSDEDQ